MGMSYELLLMNIARNAAEQASHFRECLGQHLIASYVGEYGYHARVYSGDVLDCKEIIRKEIELHNVHVIGFYIGADTRVLVTHVAKWIKERYSVTVFVGGPEAYAADANFLKESLCDFIIPGEGEKPVLGLLRYLIDHIGTLSKIKSLRYINCAGEYVENNMEPPIENLDAMPFPKRENSLNKMFRMGSSIGVLTGRGCPYQCSFCFEGAVSKMVRFRSIENVIAEIEAVCRENPNLKCVNVYDDTFTLQRQRVEAFCEYMKGKGIFWTCEGHVARICQEPDLLEKMVKSGLVAMQIGIESGSLTVLEAYHKNTTPQMIEDAVKICKKAGLPTLEGNYIVGGAYETKNTVRESIEHAKRLLELGRAMLELNTVFFAPYCGTPITKNPGNYGMDINETLNRHMNVTMRDAVCSTECMTTEQIVEAKREFDRELTEKYYKEALKCMKKELIRGAGYEHQQMRINRNWCAAWEKYPHLKLFIRHLDESEQTIDADKYPVRTVHEFTYLDGILSADGIELAGMDAVLVFEADGKRTIREIVKQQKLEIAKGMKRYVALNERGYLYFSEF